MNQPPNRRILLIDDTPSIHEDFRKILKPPLEQNQALDAMEAALFGTSDKQPQSPLFELDSAYGGQEGLQLLEAAMAAQLPYALAFVDMRMPRAGTARKPSKNCGRSTRTCRWWCVRRTRIIPGKSCCFACVPMTGC